MKLMKLIIIGICYIGFVAAFGKKQEIRVSGKLRCCSQTESGETSSNCVPPVSAEILLYDNTLDATRTNLKTIELTKGEGKYLLEWKGERAIAVKPYILAILECVKDKGVGQEYDWTNSNETDIKQDVILPFIF